MAKSGEAIISIRPNFAEAILLGSKTVELRRRIPALDVGMRLWIYATRPLAAIVGSAKIKAIVRGSPEHVWRERGAQSGLDRTSFDAYFEGADEAIALVLMTVRRGNSVSIDELRALRPGFHPPQVVARISAAEASSIGRLCGR